MFNILVCEDDRQLRELFCDVLKSEGFVTAEVSHGEDALNKLDSANFDLVITDVMMPKVDGFELVKSMRERGYDMPVLMITAMGSPEDKRTGFRAGVDDYMVKPIDIDEMVWRVPLQPLPIRRARL